MRYKILTCVYGISAFLMFVLMAATPKGIEWHMFGLGVALLLVTVFLLAAAVLYLLAKGAKRKARWARYAVRTIKKSTIAGGRR